MPLSQEIHDTADRIVRRYPVARSALLPLLHLVQSAENHITDDGIAFCAEKVGLTRAEVGSVATFYTMYKREPVGDWLLSVCTNPVCKQAGGGEIHDNYLATLGGHSDAETRVTVEHAECLGICDGAPVVQVNYEMFGPMTVAEGDQLLAACRKGAPPVSPWSGEKPPTFAEVEYDLSGANDTWEDQLHLAAQQQVAYENPPTYRTGETDVPVTHPGGDPAGVGGAVFREAAAGTVAAPAAATTTSSLPDDETAATVAGADDTRAPAGTSDDASAATGNDDEKDS
jgi:NADH-quinone oxidoreductase subunit E